MILDFYGRPLTVGRQGSGTLELGGEGNRLVVEDGGITLTKIPLPGVSIPKFTYSVIAQQGVPNPLAITNSPALVLNPDESYLYVPEVIGGLKDYVFSIEGLEGDFQFDTATGALSRVGLQPLAVSDFQNGVYSIGGQAVALEDMWRGDGGTDADQFTTSFIAGSIIPGVGWQTSSNTGWTLNSRYSTEDFMAALPWLDGITAVLEYDLFQPADSTARPGVLLRIANADRSMVWGFNQYGAGADRYVEVYDWADAFSRAPAADTPIGDTKVAVTLAPDGLAFSVAGATPFTASPVAPMADLRWIETGSYIGPGNASPNLSIATLKKISFYSALPIEKLPVLSDI